MITPLMFPIWKQRDPRWANQRLGVVDGTTIGEFGCLISVIAMAQGAYDPTNQITPGQADDIFTNNNGYANGNLVIWTAINRLLPHVAHVGFDPCINVPAPIDKLKQHLDNGGLAALQVGFGGTASRMHWLLADGYNGDNIVKCDPWFGDETDFTSKDSAGRFRYGTGIAAQDILGIHYFAQGVVPAAPIADPPPSPVAKLPASNPVPIEETIPNPRVDPPLPTPEPVPVIPEYEATYHDQPETRTINRPGAHGVDVTTGAVVVPTIPEGTVIDVAGYFTSQGVTYARTVYSKTNNKWNGLDVTYFDAPTGQPTGTVPVTIVDTPPPAPLDAVVIPDSVQSDVTDQQLSEATVPLAPKLSVLELIKELIAQIVAKFIRRKV